MHINFSPQRSDVNLKVVKQGDMLVINDVEYDFSVIPEGATLPKTATDCVWLVSDVERINGKLNLTLLLPLKFDASDDAKYPAPLIDPEDGELELPK